MGDGGERETELANPWDTARLSQVRSVVELGRQLTRSATEIADEMAFQSLTLAQR